jgi:hypothetical protein
VRQHEILDFFEAIPGHFELTGFLMTLVAYFFKQLPQLYLGIITIFRIRLAMLSVPL